MWTITYGSCIYSTHGTHGGYKPMDIILSIPNKPTEKPTINS